MQQFWIFGYGSLMWRPGFAYEESQPAVIHGYHRSLCVYSHVHRGTAERPGLVLGLDRGGSCHGVAFRVALDRLEDTLSYLRAREQVTQVYLERQAAVRLPASGNVVSAITYVVDRGHPQYAGRLPLPVQIEHVLKSSGQSGHNIDYVRSTLSHLRDMAIHDEPLERLGEFLEGQASSSAS